MRLRTGWLCGLLAGIAAVAAAHEGHDHKSNGRAKRAAAPITSRPGLILPDTGGKVPWSDKPVLNDPERFQIAIMTDRTGGHRPGVWMHGVRSLNLLRPEFVMSVGDLIEGYSTDPAEIETQWKEFLGFIDQMEMKFFFVSGNHDVSNPVMHKIWREKFGKAWYSFDYKQVHFVCLCSEDPESRLGDEQMEWIEADLAQHKDARWTFVFLHKPLWTRAESELAAGNPDPTNWKKVEQWLGDRPHNVFAGHTHHYVQFSRNKTKYYQFATTGGASRLRGIPYGEFDHVIWLTMEKDGPHLANILLDGVLPADVVTEEKINRLRSLLAQTRLEVAPILVRNRQDLTRGDLAIRLKNGFDSPIAVSARISGFPFTTDGKAQEPIKFSLAPAESAEYRVAFEFPAPIGLNHFAQSTLTATVTSQEEIPVVAEVSVPVIIDELFSTPRAPENVELDGELAEWPAPRLATRSKPLLLGAAGNWQGPDDASLQFGTAHDEQSLYLYGTVRDDRLVRGHDGLVVRLDPRPPEVRQQTPRPGKGVFGFQCVTRADSQELSVKVDNYGGPKSDGDVRAVYTPADDGYHVEIAILKSYLGPEQDNEANGAERDYQLTLSVLDVDAANESPVYVLWRGTPDLRDSNVGLGTFVLER